MSSFTWKNKGIFLSTALSIPFIAFSQQQNYIKGKVQTEDQKPLAYATIKLANTKYSTQAKDDGTFELKAPKGTYTLIISYANYNAYEQQIQVDENGSLSLDNITISAKENQLREVIVSDIQRNKFARKETEGIARMPLANLHNPQSYSVITKEIFQELGATDYNSALSQTPAAVVMNGVNDSGHNIYMRGFNMYATMRNGLPSNARTASEIYNLERVEVIKGPSATLFGAQVTSYGGVINNITKKPFESFRGEIGYTTGSWGMNRLTADINTPLNKDRTALARFNIFGMTQNGFQDAGKQQAYGAAVSLLFKASENTTVRFDADLYSPEKTLVAYARDTHKLSYSSMDQVPLDFDRSLLTDDISTKRNNMNVSAELEYRFSDNWHAKTSYQFNNSGDKESIFFVPTYTADNKIQRRYRIFDRYTVMYNSLQQNFIGTYHIGQVKNNFAGGLEYASSTINDLSMHPYFLVYDVVGIEDKAWKPISRADIQKSRAQQSPGDLQTRSGYNNYSAYVSNVTNIYDQLFVMLSLRLDRYHSHDGYSFFPTAEPAVLDKDGNVITPAKPNTVTNTKGYAQNFLSPKLGLVYQPIKDQLSVFANYMNSFRNIPSSLGLPSDQDLTLQPTMIEWNPEQANQFEFGIKTEIFNKRLNSTISYYHIRINDVLRQVADNINVQDGRQESKGIDVEIIANPLTGWNIIAGYGYNDNQYIKSASSSEKKRFTWTPENIANIWSSYKFLAGQLKGFGLGAGMKYVDKTYLDLDQKFHVPAYTTINASAFYDHAKYRIGINMNNITNVKYWDFYGKPQKPFEFLANLSFKF